MSTSALMELSIPTSSSAGLANPAAAALQRLRHELGEEAELLSHVPLGAVVTEKIHEEKAISFGILFGYMPANYFRATKNAIFFHMCPATRPDEQVQIYINTYENGKRQGRYDVQTGCKMVTELTEAFKILGTFSKGKLLALARYYFLEKLVQSGSDGEKIRYEMPISKTFVNDLKAICRVFKEAARTPSPIIETSSKKRSTESPHLPPAKKTSLPTVQPGEIMRRNFGGESRLNRSTFNISDDEDDVTIVDGPSDANRVTMEVDVAGGLLTPEPVLTGNEILSNLVKLEKNKKVLEADVHDLDRQIMHLHHKRHQKLEKVKQLQSRKENVVRKMSPIDAYRYGCQVQRVRVPKLRMEE